jgi:outer membrane protein OmpA-like peptidoglycan-associated protein
MKLKTKRFSKLKPILKQTATMKRLVTLLLTIGIMAGAHAQSTTGWKPVFQDDFSNNKSGWGLNDQTKNTSKISFNNKRLVLEVFDNGDKRSTVYTKVNFNEDFILKTKVSAATEEKVGKDPTQFGLYFGYSSHKYKDEQGWYGMLLEFHEDKIWMAANNENGSRLFERLATDVSYDSKGDTEIGVVRQNGKVEFYVNGKKVYENDATTTSGGAISFYAARNQKALMSAITVYEKDIPPTPEEVAQEKALDEAVSEEEESVIVNAVSNLEFASGKSTISDKSIPALNQMAEMMVRNTKFRVILKGHTDDVGDPAANQKLSQDRVNSVIAYLVGKGINKDRLVGLGYGDKQPIADNETAEGRQKNRRVEFEIVL